MQTPERQDEIAGTADQPTMNPTTPAPPSARALLAAAQERHGRATVARLTAKRVVLMAQADAERHLGPGADSNVNAARIILADAEAEARAAAQEIVAYSQRARQEPPSAEDVRSSRAIATACGQDGARITARQRAWLAALFDGADKLERDAARWEAEADRIRSSLHVPVAITCVAFSSTGKAWAHLLENAGMVASMVSERIYREAMQ
jgi:hypothetical protein